MNIRRRYWWLAAEVAAAEVAAKLVRARELGFYVVGLCTPEGPTSQADPVLIASRDVPVVGVDTAVIDAVKRTAPTQSPCHLPTI